jgi:hypothetical protein
LIASLRDTSGIDALPLLGNVVEVRLHWDRGAAIDLAIWVCNDAIVVSFLDPFVDDASRPSINHVGTKYGGLIIESSFTTDVTTSLREKYWKAIAFSHCLKTGVSRILISCHATPFVRIKTEEIDRFVGVTTSKVILQHGAKLSNISGGISNWDLAVCLDRHVRLHVCNSRFDIWR